MMPTDTWRVRLPMGRSIRVMATPSVFLSRMRQIFNDLCNFWLTLWKRKLSNRKHHGVSDLQPTLVACRIFDVMPLTAKKSVCVEDATKKCRISDMQGVGFWVEILLCMMVRSDQQFCSLKKKLENATLPLETRDKGNISSPTCHRIGRIWRGSNVQSQETSAQKGHHIALLLHSDAGCKKYFHRFFIQE